MLQLIFISPLETILFERFSLGDDIVFLEKSVLNLLKQGRFNRLLTELQVKYKLYVLADDLAVRGITENEIVQGIQFIDYTDLVQLTIKHKLIHSWT